MWPWIPCCSPRTPNPQISSSQPDWATTGLTVFVVRSVDMQGVLSSICIPASFRGYERQSWPPGRVPWSMSVYDWLTWIDWMDCPTPTQLQRPLISAKKKSSRRLVALKVRFGGLHVGRHKPLGGGPQIDKSVPVYVFVGHFEIA